MKTSTQRMLVAVGVLLIGTLVLVGQSPYQNKGVVVKNKQHIHVDQQQLQLLISAVQITPVAQINPAYVSSYAPDGYDAAIQADLLQELRTLKGIVASHDRFSQQQAGMIAAALAAGKAPAAVLPPGHTVTPGVVPDIPPGSVVPVPNPVPLTPPGSKGKGGFSGLDVLTRKCAACHQAGNLAPEQRFALLGQNGSLSPLTDKQKWRLFEKCYLGKMPPPQNSKGITPLNDDEFFAIVEMIGGGN